MNSNSGISRFSIIIMAACTPLTINSEDMASDANKYHPEKMCFDNLSQPFYPLSDQDCLLKNFEFELNPDQFVNLPTLSFEDVSNSSSEYRTVAITGSRISDQDKPGTLSDLITESTKSTKAVPFIESHEIAIQKTTIPTKKLCYVQQRFICRMMIDDNKMCNNSFTSLSNLKKNHNIHTQKNNNTVHTCNICGKTFRKKDQFRIHNENYHFAPKSHTCAICNTGFSQSGFLKNHMRIHTGEKPYVCKICGIGYTRNYTLKIHLKKHYIESSQNLRKQPFTLSKPIIPHKITRFCATCATQPKNEKFEQRYFLIQ